MGISEQSTLLCEQKLLTSRQIFRYAVPARTVTKKALIGMLVMPEVRPAVHWVSIFKPVVQLEVNS